MFKKSFIDYIDTDIMPFIDFPEYPDRYPALSVEIFDKEMYEELRHASVQLFNIFTKVCKHIQNNDNNILIDLGIDKKLIKYMNIQNLFNLPSWLSRFDYVLDQHNNLKFVEINADTPCAFVEAYYANQIACDYHNVNNPNKNEYYNLIQFMTDLNSRLVKTVDFKNNNFSKEHPILFSCFDDYFEDLGTTRFLMNAMNRVANNVGVVFESLYKIWVDDDGLILNNHLRPQAIYRMHPLELLIEEKATDGTNLGEFFMNKYSEGKFVMINPPESIILQLKSFQALVWHLADLQHSILTKNEIDTVHKYMLPTYLNINDIINLHGQWIKKPIYGREGLEIEIIDIDNNTTIERTYSHKHVPTKSINDCIYQQFVDQPIFTANTNTGIHQGYITLSSFVLANKAGAVYGRFSLDKICNTDAYWLPLGY